MKLKIKPLMLGATLISSSIALQVTAHPRWILPSHFAFSKESGQWAAFDVSASNDVFRFDKPASADSAQIIDPQGTKHRPNFILKSKRRSSFDYFFEKPGTYKISASNPAKYWTRYTNAEGKEKWLAANKLQRDSLLPEGAKNASTVIYHTTVETYLTQGAPNKTSFALQKKNLELVPVTHPSSLVAGEAIEFIAYNNGNTQAGVEVQLELNGSHYRNNRELLKAVTDQSGKFSITPHAGGVYLLKANLKGDANSDQADKVNYSAHITLSVEQD